MAQFALIENGVVKELFEEDPRRLGRMQIPQSVEVEEGEEPRTELVDVDVPGWPADLDIRKVANKVEAGMVVAEDGTFSHPPPGAPDLPTFARLSCTQAEQKPVDGGFVLGDLERLRNAKEYLDAHGDKKVKWYSGGSVRELSSSEVSAAIFAIVDRQQEAFSTYAEVVAAIDAGTTKTPQQVQDAFGA